MPPCGKTDSSFVFENIQRRRSRKPWRWAECQTSGSDALRMLAFLSRQLPQVRARIEARRLGSSFHPVMWSEFLSLYRESPCELQQSDPEVRRCPVR